MTIDDGPPMLWLKSGEGTETGVLRAS